MSKESRTFKDLRKLVKHLSEETEGRYQYEYQPHVGNRTQTIHLNPRGSKNLKGDWIAWTPFGDVESGHSKDRVRRAAKNSTGLSFRKVGDTMRAQVLLQAESPVEVWVRLVRHLGEVADRLEFRHSKGDDTF